MRQASAARNALRALALCMTAAASGAWFAGCGIGSLFNVNLFIVGEQTSLEKQVLGTYSALGEDLLAYSSVRGVSPDGSLTPAPPATGSQRAAWAAMRNREYNRDDLELLLRAERVGEGADGTLVARDETAPVTGLTPAQIETLVAEENRDRAVVLERLAATLAQPTEAQLGEVRWIFARLNHENAPDGAWIQQRDGEWVRK